MRINKLTREQQNMEDEKRRMYKKATRVNVKVTDPAVLPMQTVVARADVRGKDGYVKRKRLPNEALPQQHTTLWNPETYRTGDGDTPAPIRPGSLDFKKCPSRGIG